MTFEVAQDAVDYGGIDDEGDDLHLGAAFTKQRIRFVDAANQLSPCTSRGASLGRGWVGVDGRVGEVAPVR